MKREKLTREELIISLTRTAGEKFPRSFILTMTSWKTDQHCRAVLDQQEPGHNHQWEEVTGHHHHWCHLLLHLVQVATTLCSHHNTTSHLNQLQHHSQSTCLAIIIRSNYHQDCYQRILPSVLSSSLLMTQASKVIILVISVIDKLQTTALIF